MTMLCEMRQKKYREWWGKTGRGLLLPLSNCPLLPRSTSSFLKCYITDIWRVEFQKLLIKGSLNYHSIQCILRFMWTNYT